MPHFLTVALDHDLQLFDAFRRGFALIKAVQPVEDGEHAENEIDTDIHGPAMVTQLTGKQYRGIGPAAQEVPLPTSCAHVYRTASQRYQPTRGRHDFGLQPMVDGQ